MASGRHRVVAVGDHVPESVRGWPSTLWVRSVPHAYLFPKCGCVIHHGGSGTSAAAAAAGVPSVVVPFLGWSDQPRFAAWLARAAAGVAVTDPASLDAAGWAAAVERAATDATLKAGAAALGRLMASEGGGGAAGAAAAVAAIDAHFGAEKVEKAPKEKGGALVAAAAASTAAASQLEALKSLKLSDGGKLRAGLYCLFREPSALPLQTYQARDTWLKTLGKQLVEFPLYKADWPPKHKPLDLALHDLPHASSLIEWWYYHAHLTAQDGSPVCVFVALFQLQARLGHAPHLILHRIPPLSTRLPRYCRSAARSSPTSTRRSSTTASTCTTLRASPTPPPPSSTTATRSATTTSSAR